MWSPLKAGSPVSARYVMAAREKRSVLWVTSAPAACSGAMYSGVPTIRSRVCVDSCPESFETPKSENLPDARRGLARTRGGRTRALCVEDVPGLQISVHDPRGARGGQAAANLNEHRDHLVQLEAGLAAQAFREILAAEALHGDVRDLSLAVEATDLQDAHDVRCVERRGHLRLAHEALHDGAVPKRVRVEELHGGLLAILRMEGLVDLAHRPAPDDVAELIGSDRSCR